MGFLLLFYGISLREEIKLDLMGLLVYKVQLEGLFLVYLPFVFGITGLLWFSYSIFKRKRKQSFLIPLLIGIGLLAIPILKYVVLAFSFLLGAPVPS